MLLGQADQLGRAGIRTLHQVQVDPPLQRGQVPLLQRRGHGPLQPVRTDLVEWGAAPQRQRGGQTKLLGSLVRRRRSVIEQAVESERVHVIRLGRQQVAPRPGRDQLPRGSPQGAAQPHDARTDVGPRVAVQIRTPHRGRQPIRRDGTAC
jgi:hypothetical protein